MGFIRELVTKAENEQNEDIQYYPWTITYESDPITAANDEAVHTIYKYKW